VRGAIAPFTRFVGVRQIRFGAARRHARRAAHKNVSATRFGSRASKRDALTSLLRRKNSRVNTQEFAIDADAAVLARAVP
jgi:hypothetical protein